MDRMVEGINQRSRPAQFALSLAAKDAALALEAARAQGVPAPVASAVAGVFREAAEGGLGERDWSDLVEWMERQTDCRLELPSREG
jgi:3-hydroxyisobutyrate dehydrogenase-like beta-hydroxyacid dehydrogenase